MHEAILKSQVMIQDSARRKYLELEAYRKYSQALNQVITDVLQLMPENHVITNASINDYSSEWANGSTYLNLNLLAICDSPQQLIPALEYLADNDPDNIKVTANGDGSADYAVTIRQPKHQLVWFLNIHWSPSEQSTCELVVVGTRKVEKGSTITVDEPVYEVRCKA